MNNHVLEVIAGRLYYARQRLVWARQPRSEPIVVTHCGKLGDFILSLPVASWLYKTRRRKIHFVLASRFALFHEVEPLLMLQEMTERVTLADFPVTDWHCGGQPYKFDPRDFGVSCGEFYNLGFRSFPQRYVPRFVGEEYGLGYDPEFRINLGPCPKSAEILCTEPFITTEAPEARCIPFDQPLLENIRRLAGARECHVSQSGPFHILDMAGIRPTRLYIYPHQAELRLFSPNVAALDIVRVDRPVR